LRGRTAGKRLKRWCSFLSFVGAMSLSNSSPRWLSGGAVFFAGVREQPVTVGGGGAVAPLPLFFLAGEPKAPASSKLSFPFTN
jgi:hypothetical protein